jgi:alpha-tubulin suppressor-like RCC1 family protein
VWGLVLLLFTVSPAFAARTSASKGETSAATRVRAVGSGEYHSLAVTSTGGVLAWGWNMVGQLGNGSTNGSDVPVKVKLPAGTKVTAVAGGFAHSLALTSSGAIVAWGKNYNGDLGTGTTTDSDVPLKVTLPVGTKVIAIAAGTDHNLAATSTGSALAWGLNNYGQLGNGGTGSSSVPVSVTLPAGTKVTAVAAGSLHSLAVTSTGGVLAWGYNLDGELGDGTRTSSDVPVKVKLPAGTKVVAVAAAGFTSLALTTTGAVLAWGYNKDGELGDGNLTSSDLPVKVKLPPGTKVVAIAARGFLGGVGAIIPGPGHSLALTSTGAVFAWGDNNDGELGNGSTKASAVPAKVKLGSVKVTGIAAGFGDSLAVTSSGAVLAWGANDFGQLGDGSYEQSDVPVKVNLP